ncbi:calcium-binding protein [Shinella sp. WSJ-2]|uniref:calcium-binding protein n=1 Tax=Shinella sp. WSJ-2 TaxID=2303749 RepID=UPI000E3E7789|nr:calcium-binding protein [Shinella sp. WSJ-2]RFZ88058.1 calcium-binding protein [Shinella sp. WSJ-2]
MAIQIFGTNSIGTGIRADLGATDSIFVASGVTVGRTDIAPGTAAAIIGTGSKQTAEIHGNVVSTGVGVSLGDDPAADILNSLYLGEGGIIRSYYSAGAVVAGWMSHVENRGEIRGYSSGLIIGGSNANTESVVDNSGEIVSYGTAITRYPGATEKLVINNSGVLRGFTAFSGGGADAVDIINNTGLIVGDIGFGGGNDTYDGRDGKTEGTIFGGEGNDTLLGGADEDRFDGGSGIDQMEGGKGDDSYIVSEAGDVIVEKAGEGTDFVDSFSSYTLADNIENLRLRVNDTTGTGNAIANSLTGNSGKNTLIGLDGNDTLDGAGGVDTLIGGKGDDTYIVDNVDDVVTELSGEGTDTVKASVSTTLSANVENLTLTGNTDIDGTGNERSNILTGNEGKNTLKGMAGNDMLYGGGGGADVLEGGAGDDTYIIDDGDGTVTELAGEGTDTVKASVTHTLSANVETLILTGADDIDGTGSDDANTLTGNAGSNLLRGLKGNDTLDGRGGVDQMEGGIGNDIYVVDNSGDTIVELSGEGTDTVKASKSYALSANVETLILTGTGNINGTGSADANTLTGNAGKNVLKGMDGNDLLNGGAGRDRMEGGKGNDTFVVDNAGDVVVEASGAGTGTDTVKASVTFALADNVENLALTGTGDIGGTGNSAANILTGNSGKNTLIGLAGNDTLNGGAGTDHMEGGTGNDTYMVDSGGDGIVEFADEGTDTVMASVSHTLATNVEKLVLTGTGNLNGTGNELANTLTGNAGANILNGLAGNDVLDGGAGADRLEGGIGNDTLVIDNAGDKVVELSGEGTDTVKASVSHTLAANVEKLVLTGTGNLNGTGNELANTLTGNAGANILKGMAGNDTLVGGAGADQLYGGAGKDMFVFNSVADSKTTAMDKIFDFSHAEGDRIDLHAIDANGVLAGDQAFSFIGTSAFHNKAGELRFEQKSGDTFIHGDINGDGKADFSIALDTLVTLTASDFLL